MNFRKINTVPVWESLKLHPKIVIFKIQFLIDAMYVRVSNILALTQGRVSMCNWYPVYL